MPFDEYLAERVRALVSRRTGFSEKKMFGGVAFLLYGNMCIDVWKEFLILRIGPDDYEALLDEPHVREFDITGKPMRGWIMVEPDAIDLDYDLNRWADRAIEFVRTLPKKT